MPRPWAGALKRYLTRRKDRYRGDSVTQYGQPLFLPMPLPDASAQIQIGNRNSQSVLKSAKINPAGF